MTNFLWKVVIAAGTVLLVTFMSMYFGYGLLVTFSKTASSNGLPVSSGQTAPGQPAPSPAASTTPAQVAPPAGLDTQRIIDRITDSEKSTKDFLENMVQQQKVRDEKQDKVIGDLGRRVDALSAGSPSPNGPAAPDCPNGCIVRLRPRAYRN